MVAAAPPGGQKGLFGERLMPLIGRLYPDIPEGLSARLTGMILELDNMRLMEVMETREAFFEILMEAMDTLTQKLEADRAAGIAVEKNLDLFLELFLEILPTH